MKVVYGNPKTILTLGMTLLGETPTPFIGFVDKAKVEGDPFFATGPDSTALINKIDTLGGVIVYIENPEAAQRLHEMLHALFASASTGPWSDVEEVEAGLQ
jgi:hypothetical protein